MKWDSYLPHRGLTGPPALARVSEGVDGSPPSSRVVDQLQPRLNDVTKMVFQPDLTGSIVQEASLLKGGNSGH